MTPKAIFNDYQINITELAKTLGVTRACVYKWHESKNGIPAERCIQIEKITGIPRCKLRPDLWGYANA